MKSTDQPAIVETPETIAAERNTLRATLAEIVAKRKADREKSAERETALTNAQQRVAELENELREVKVAQPLRKVAQEASINPELFLSLLDRAHQVASGADGELQLQTKDSKPVMVGGKPLTLSNHTALSDHLLDTPDGPLWGAVLVGTRASGAVAPAPQRRAAQSVRQRKPSMQFGLK